MSDPRPEADRQWEEWSRAWAAEPAAGAGGLDALRSRAGRQRRRQALVMASEVALMVALVAFSVGVVAAEPRPWHAIWLATLWGFAAVAMGFAWWNRRSTWRASGDSVEAYVRLARLRTERHLRSLRFAELLFAAEALVVVAQLLWFDRLVPWAILLLAVAGAGLLVWCRVARRRSLAELRRIAAFERELGEEGERTPDPLPAG
jgi:hypothetical protein